MDRIRPMSNKQDRSGQNGPNKTNVNPIEPKWTEWTELDQSRPNGPNKTESDESGQNGLNMTNMDQMDLIGPKQAEQNQSGPKMTAWTEQKIRIYIYLNFIAFLGLIFIISSVYFICIFLTQNKEAQI